MLDQIQIPLEMSKLIAGLRSLCTEEKIRALASRRSYLSLAQLSTFVKEVNNSILLEFNRLYALDLVYMSPNCKKHIESRIGEYTVPLVKAYAEEVL